MPWQATENPYFQSLTTDTLATESARYSIYEAASAIATQFNTNLPYQALTKMGKLSVQPYNPLAFISPAINQFESRVQSAATNSISSSIAPIIPYLVLGIATLFIIRDDRL